MATSRPEPNPMLLAYSSEGSPRQRRNVHPAHSFHRANGLALDDAAIQKVSTEPLAVKPVKSLPDLGAYGVHGGANPTNNFHAGALPGPSINAVPDGAVSGPQFKALPYPTADVNGRPVHAMEPLPITSWDQPPPGYPHVGYIPGWDRHAYMTGMPGTGPVLPPGVQQAPPDLVMHNWTPEFAPPVPLECVPRGFVHSHFAYHPITRQHCAVWIPGAAQLSSVY